MYGNNCYKVFSDTKKAVNEAQNTCENHGGYLAHISDEQENEFVTSLLDGGDAWIGLNSLRTPDKWKWIDSNKSLLADKAIMWAPGNSQVVGKNPDCVRLAGDGTWANVPCRQELDYVCEISADQCPHDFAPFREKCYKVGFSEERFDHAVEVCSEEGAILAVVHDKDENDFINTLRPLGDLWIGYYDHDGDQIFEWVDGEQHDFTYWWSGQQPLASRRNESVCVKMDEASDHGYWSGDKCGEEKNFVCQMDGEQPPKSTKCPPEYDYWMGQCYGYHSTEMAYGEAERACEEKGAGLVWVTNAYENEMLRTTYVASEFWIGLTDVLEEGQFQWTQGKGGLRYKNWQGGKTSPVGWAKDRNCVQMNSDGTWSNVPCSQPLSFVCKYDLGR